MMDTSGNDSEAQGGLDPDSRLMTARQVAQRHGVSVRTIDRWLKDEGLQTPRPIYINDRRYFVVSEWTAWLERGGRRG